MYIHILDVLDLTKQSVISKNPIVNQEVNGASDVTALTT